MTDAVSGIYRAFECICLQWTTAEEVDRTLNFEKSLCSSQIRVGDYDVMLSFFCIGRMANLMRPSISIKAFSYKLACSLYRFYFNNFITSKQLELSAKYESVHDEIGDI